MKIPSRMTEADLFGEASRSAGAAYGPKAKNYDAVVLSMAVNAHAVGFYMGARHIEKTRKPVMGFFARLFAWFVLLFSRRLILSRIAADQYLKETFPSISTHDEALVRSAIATGFDGGTSFMRGKLPYARA